MSTTYYLTQDGKTFGEVQLDSLSPTERSAIESVLALVLNADAERISLVEPSVTSVKTVVPQHWFKPIQRAGADLLVEPFSIEYLKGATGETLTHEAGTAFWIRDQQCLDVPELTLLGFTHYRVLQ